MSHYIYLLIEVVLALTVVGLFVLLGQFLWAKKVLRGEYSRKFTHMCSAAWIASWGYLFDQWVIVAMALALGLGVYLTKHLKIFESIYSVRRVTHGELTYAAAIAASAILFSEPAVFALCVVNLGFADGLAAIVGKKFGKVRYRVLGANKSFAGAVACFLFAVFAGAVFWQFTGAIESTSILNAEAHIILASLAITLSELAGQKGLDNLAIPMITGVAYMGVI